MADLERNTRTVAGMTLVSRVFGLARDLVLVRIFADSAVGSGHQPVCGTGQGRH